MWAHFCGAENGIVHICDSDICEWCGKVKEEVE